MDNLLTLQLPFYCSASFCRWVACQEAQGSSDPSGTLRRGLCLLHCFPGEVAGNWTWHFLMAPGLKPVAPGTWVISSGWLQSWPDLLCPLGNKFKRLKLKASNPEQCAGLFHRFSAAQLLVGDSFGPSAALSKPVALQNSALFQTISPSTFEFTMLKYQRVINNVKPPSKKKNTKHEFH